MSAPALLRAVREYLTLRRALGFKLHNETWYLPDFVAFLSEHGSPVITTELVLSWAQQRSNTSPNTWAKRLSSIKGFANYMRALDPRTAVLPRDLVPWRKQRPMPHIYTEQEIAALLRASRRIRGPLLGVTYFTLIGLLAATGMRLGEALALEDRDVDWSRSVLLVRCTKFQKTRLVPVHASTLAALKRYRLSRDRIFTRHESPTFFVSSFGRRLHRSIVDRSFVRLLRRIGIVHGPGRRPRLHDFRHTFAVTTLRDWYRAGIDVDRRLPALSTYLGHVNPSTTYWYLTATPELLVAAGKRLSRAWEVRP
jgi:integrase